MYYSDRKKGPKARTIEEITIEAWRGIWALITTRLNDGSFGEAFPEECPDGNAVIGHAPGLLEATALGDGIVWPIEKDVVPDTLAVMDLLEFCYAHVAEAKRGNGHPFFSHYHLYFDLAEGKANFRAALERVLSRNGIAFEMNDDGEMRRLGPPQLAAALKSAVFHTGDDVLDGLLEAARRKFTDPDLSVRKEALEKLWDGFERLKTIEAGKDKKAQSQALLTKAIADADLRERIDKDMRELTEIGNQFMIRHTEVGKKPITDSDEVDYLFQRMFGVMRLLLRGTKRGG